MTDRYHSFTVVLDRDIREDDAEEIMKAIAMFRNVISVKGNVADPTSAMAEVRAKHELRERLWEMAKEK